MDAPNTSKATSGECPRCGEHSFLMPLHGGKGGLLCCPLCVGAWNAEHGRKRRTGRIVIRAIMAFHDAGGRKDDVEKLMYSAFFGNNPGLLNVELGDKISDPLGYMADIAKLDGADIELSSELLADVLSLTHPDHHPPEREELARRVTQQLLALQPFVFPAPKPKEPIVPTEERPWHKSIKDEEPQPRFPCPDCADNVPYYYCDACRAEWNKREHEKAELRRAKQREQYKRRGKMPTPPRDKDAAKIRGQRQSVVAVNQSPTSNLINHKLSGLQAAILVTAFTKRVPGARGADVSQAELLAEIWGWGPLYGLRWTKEAVERYGSDCAYRAGDTLPNSRTHGAFNYIAPYERRAARASLSRALARLGKRMLISFVDGTYGTYGGGIVLTPHGEQIARQLMDADRDHSTNP